MILGLGAGEGPWASGYVLPGESAPAVPPMLAPAPTSHVVAGTKKILSAATAAITGKGASSSSIPWGSIAKYSLIGVGVVGAVILLSARSERQTRRNPDDDDDDDADEEDDDDDDDDVDENPRKAADFYRSFQWGREPKKISRVAIPPRPRELVKLGVLEAITYSTKKGGEKLADYIHHFGEEGHRKPTLTADPRTKKLHIIGGDYGIESAGIVR
jgi:hypothetical protein